MDSDLTFTKFHSKELQRAFRELNSKEFMVFISMTRLILQFNCNKNFRSISYENLVKELPIKISVRSLKTHVKSLLEKNFISKFTHTQLGENVYSLIRTPKDTGYSKIDNFVITQISELIQNDFDFKLYMLIYSGIVHFSKKSFKKYFSDLISLMGLVDTRNNRNNIKKGITHLRKLKLIAVNEFQRSKLERKRFNLKISFFWLQHSITSAKSFGERKIPVIFSSLGVQNNTTESAKKRIGECKNPQTYKKETKLKNKINSKRISETDEIQFNSKNVSKSKSPNIFDFNFYGLNKFKNPLTPWSIKNVLKNNPLLTKMEIQLSLKRFSEYQNSKYWDKSIQDPIAFLISHLIKFGEFIPPEEFLQNGHKEEYELDDLKHSDLVRIDKSSVSFSCTSKIGESVERPKQIPRDLESKYLALAKQEIMKFSDNDLILNNDRIVYSRALNLYLGDL